MDTFIGAQFVDYLIRRIVLDMRLKELNALLSKAEKEKRFVEAFMVKSAYVESVVTILSTSLLFSRKQYDGKLKSVEADMKKSRKVKKEFKEYGELDLKKKINLLSGLKKGIIETDTQKKLHKWREDWNGMKHDFAEKMLQKTLEKDARNGYKYIQRITKERWFTRMEENFLSVEKTLK